LPQLRALDIDTDHFHLDRDRIQFVLSDVSIDRLVENSIAFTIIDEDVQQTFLQLNERASFHESEKIERRSNWESNCASTDKTIKTPQNFKEGSMGGYMTLAEMNEAIDAMIQQYPNLVSDRIDLGESIEGRPLYAIKISDRPNEEEEEPNILYTALHHAREPMSMHQLIFFMWYLLENYDEDVEIKNIVDHRALYFIPCVNPDGYQYNYEIKPDGGGLWRKNRRENSDGSRGVDLNRNYPVDWGNERGSSGNPGSDIYRGEEPFSEPEIKVIKDFADRIPFTIVLDYHSFGELLIRPSLGFSEFPADEILFDQHENSLTEFNCYEAGDDQATVGYIASGTSSDWHYYGKKNNDLKSLAWIPEVGRGFWPTKDKIIPYSKDNLHQNIKAAQYAGAKIEWKETSPIAIQDSENQLILELNSIGLTDRDITLRVESSAYVNLKNSEFVIPRKSISESAEPFVQIIDYELIVGVPASAPIEFKLTLDYGAYQENQYLLKLWKPNSILSFDFQNGLDEKWNTVGSWGVVADQNDFSNKVLTDSPNGLYSPFSQAIVTYNEPFDLPDAGSAYLSFDVRYQLDDCKDQFYVEIGSFGANGEATSFEPICGDATIVKNLNFAGELPSLIREQKKWTQVIYPLDEFVGMSDLAFRLRLRTDERNEKDGVYIDNVQIIQSEMVTPLAVDLLSFEGALLLQKQVLLNWETTNEENAAYFSIEQSSDAVHFREIGEVPAIGNTLELSTYEFLDEAPSSPVSYYRLKMVDVDESFSYSDVIAMDIFRPIELRKIFPNPSSDMVHLNLESKSKLSFDYQFYNLLGQTMLTGTAEIEKGTNNLSLDLSHLPKGVYIFYVPDAMIRMEERIVKY